MNAIEAAKIESVEVIGIKLLMMMKICRQAQVSRERDKIHLREEVIMEAPSEGPTFALLTEVRFSVSQLFVAL